MANVKLSQIPSGGAFTSGTDAIVSVRNGSTDVLTTIATTGTGNYVLASGATITSPTVSGGTINNTAIGSTTSAAVTATTISGVSMNLTSLSASQTVATDSSKNLVSVATTGSGNYVLTSGATITTPTISGGTINNTSIGATTSAAVTATTISGTSLNLTGLSASQAVATDSGKNFVSVANTGTGSNVLGTSPTISGGTFDAMAIGANVPVAIQGYRPINTQTGSSYTLVIGDSGKLVTTSNASANTLIIPTNASVAFPIGTEVDVSQIGTGQTTFSGSGGSVTVQSYTAKLAITGQFAGATIKKLSTDVWLLTGNLS